MARRYNKMITLTHDDILYIDNVFKRNFSQWVSQQLSAHAAGLQFATQLSTKQLLAIVLGRQDFDHPKREMLVQLIMNDEFC